LPVVRLRNGIFVFDSYWDEVYRNQFNFNFRWPELDANVRSKADSLRKSHVMFCNTVSVEPGTYQVVVESRDRSLGSIGLFRGQNTYAFSDSVLAMSDLLLASDIQEKTPFPQHRADLEICPNPIRTFGRSDTVLIYLEIYHLTQDEFGRTRYEIRYRIGQPEREAIDPAMFAALDLSGPGGSISVETIVLNRQLTLPEHGNKNRPDMTYQVQYVFPERNRILAENLMVSEGVEMETAVTAQYRGNLRDDLTYLQIDIAQVPEGVHILTASITDILSGQMVEKDILFRAVE